MLTIFAGVVLQWTEHTTKRGFAIRRQNNQHYQVYVRECVCLLHALIRFFRSERDVLIIK